VNQKVPLARIADCVRHYLADWNLCLWIFLYRNVRHCWRHKIMVLK